MTSTELDTTEDTGPPPALSGQGALALTPDQTGWTEMQEAALAQLGLKDAPHGDRLVFLHQCQRTGLDPFARQIYMIGRNDKGTVKYTIQTGIDGFRAVAEEHPEYRGQTAPEWCGKDGEWRDVWLDDQPPAAARVGVLRGDRETAIYATVLFREFAQYRPDGNRGEVLTSMWKTKGAHMLAKCAEAGGLRKAFPQRLSGLVTDDEAAAFERANSRQRVQSQRDPAGVVSSDELAGDVVEPEQDEVAGDAPQSGHATPADPPAPGTHARMTQAQSKRLFPLIRQAGDSIDNRNAWASRVLGRKVSTFGDVSEADAELLLDNAEGLVAAAGVTDAEVVEEGEQGAT